MLVPGTATVSAADFQVDSGDVFDLGGGVLDLGCADFTLRSGAIFNAGSGDVSLSGNWVNQGIFNPGVGRVVFTDDCGEDSISMLIGDTSFYNLVASTTQGHELRFDNGRYQSVEKSLVLTGSAQQLLKIRSVVPGSPGFLVLDTTGSQTIDWVDVQDNHAAFQGQRLAPDSPEVFHSIKREGTFRWFLDGLNAVPVATLPLYGLVLLVLLLILMYRHKRRLFQPC